jgi:hypothetical protein
MVPLTDTLTLRGGTGVHRQEPGFVEVLGSHGTPTCAPSARITPTSASKAGSDRGPLAVTAYDREDRDLLRLPYTERASSTACS